jgi:hypothetical protein
MIAESKYYKDDLLRFARQLGRWTKAGSWTQRRWYEFERELLLSMIVVRRLSESAVISDKVASQPVQLRTYKLAPKKIVHRMNSHRIDELYDWNASALTTRPLVFVANQIIHSYVLTLLKGPGREISVFVASDRERNRVAYLLSAREVDKILRSVGLDYPDQMNMRWNDQRGDYDWHLTTTTPPRRRVRGGAV